MTVKTKIEEINIKQKIAELEALEAKTRNLLKTLEATADGQLRHRTIWKDNVAAIAAANTGVAAPTLRLFGATGSGTQRKEYVFGTGDSVYIAPFHVNHDILPGAKVYPHVHWSTDGTDTGNVQWELTIIRALGHDQAAFDAQTVIQIEQAASGTTWQHMVAECSDGDALTVTEPDELICIVLERIAASTDENTDSVFGLMVDLHYESNTIGTINKAPNFYI